MEFPEIWPYISWKIKDVSYLNRTFTKVFYVEGYRFYIELEKKLYSNAKEDCLEMQLTDIENGLQDNCSFMMSTYLKDIHGENHFIQRSSVVRTNGRASRPIWRVRLFELFDNRRLNWKENLDFVFMFGPESHYQNVFEDDISDSSHLCSYKDNLEKLSLEISKLYDQRSHGDVILKCEDKKIFADKNILSVRSPVFRKLFENDVVQQTPTEVDISGVDYCSLKSLLSFLYSGSVLFHQTVEDAVKLYEVAQKYQVSGLQEDCRKFLVRNLKEDTAYRFLLYASEKDDEKFLSSVMSYISKTDILKSKRWIEFSNKHPDLALETYFKYLDNYILTRSNLEYIHKHS